MSNKLGRRELMGAAGAMAVVGALGAAAQDSPVNLKIVGVCCSPRAGKTTSAALALCLAAAKEKEAMEADLSSYGIDPSSGRYANLDLQRRMNTAKNVVGARTDARTRARDENFARLTAGMAARGKVTGLPGTQAMSGSGESFGNYNLQNLAGQAGSFYGGATSAANANMVRLGENTRDKYREWSVGSGLGWQQ